MKLKIPKLFQHNEINPYVTCSKQAISLVLSFHYANFGIVEFNNRLLGGVC